MDRNNGNAIKKNMRIRRWARLIIVVIILVMALSLLEIGGYIKKDPVVEVQADNCYEKTLVVAADEDYWPYVYYDEDGNLTGHDVEMINIVANRMNMNVEILTMSWEESLKMAERHEVDAVLTCEYGDEEARQESLIMTTPVDSGRFVVFGKEKIERIDQLAGKRIGFLENGNVTKAIYGQGLEEFCVKYSSNKAAFQALVSGECDYVVVRYVIGIGILEDMGKEADGIEGYVYLSNSNMCIGVNSQEEELAEAISRTVLEMREDGTIDQLNEKWLTTFVEKENLIDTMKENPWIPISTLLIIMIAVLLIINEEIAKAKARDAAVEQANAANQAKSNFLFSMSHDIRTPMNAITGFVMMAKKRVDDPKAVGECLDKIDMASQQLLELVNGVLDMARIESGNTQLKVEPIDLLERAQAISDIIEVSAKKNELEFVRDFHIKNRFVYVDIARLDQVVTNVLSNAIKYTPAGGHIGFTINELPGEASEYGLYSIEIADTGIGMSQEFLEHVFDDFSREETATVSGIQGAGLGMSIVKRLTDLMGGEVFIESQQGKGTIIKVVLPMRLIDETEYRKVIGQSDGPEESAVDISRISGRRVLLVEDNELNREIACDILEDMGITVETAEDGDVAVDMVAASDAGYYNCILMDIQMPRMDGYEATGKIRALEDEALAGIPIIALTANAFEEDKQNAIDAGMDGHLAKPIETDRLFEILQQL